MLQKAIILMFLAFFIVHCVDFAFRIPHLYRAEFEIDQIYCQKRVSKLTQKI